MKWFLTLIFCFALGNSYCLADHREKVYIKYDTPENASEKDAFTVYFVFLNKNQEVKGVRAQLLYGPHDSLCAQFKMRPKETVLVTIESLSHNFSAFNAPNTGTITARFNPCHTEDVIPHKLQKSVVMGIFSLPSHSK